MSLTISERTVCDFGARQLTQTADFLVAACDPIGALRLLEEAPSFLAKHPLIRKAVERLRPRIAHTLTNEAYADFYGNLGEEVSTYHGGPFQDHNLLTLPRARFVLDHLVKNPNVKSVLSVGCGDGTLEKKILDDFPAVSLWISELNPVGNLAIKALQDLYPTRVHLAPALGLEAVEAYPEVDLVMCLEVIEHVMDPELFVTQLVRCVNDCGACLISTPNPAEWVEYYHCDPTDRAQGEDMIQHIRGVTAGDLRDYFWGCGLSGLVAVVGGTLLGVFTRHQEIPSRAPDRIGPIADVAELQNSLVFQDWYAPNPIYVGQAQVRSINGRVFYPLQWAPGYSR